MKARGRPTRDLTAKLIVIGFLLLLGGGDLVAFGQPTPTDLTNVLLHISGIPTADEHG